MKPAIRALGRADYEPVWRAMQAFTKARDDATPDELWFVEHPPVFTLGLAAKP
ncbi:MAG: lipoyl(octanoyl) transferase, partial [Betaproteobacteria bacterium]|nr:lipoyl(octanoyl) transferase [Betaproteobacteria bacterium]